MKKSFEEVKIESDIDQENLNEDRFESPEDVSMKNYLNEQLYLAGVQKKARK